MSGLFKGNVGSRFIISLKMDNMLGLSLGSVFKNFKEGKTNFLRLPIFQINNFRLYNAHWFQVRGGFCFKPLCETIQSSSCRKVSKKIDLKKQKL